MTDAPAPADAPSDLIENLKDDLGIPASDATQDEWLQRRVDSIWSRIEHYTNRRLCIPPAQFVDDWTQIAGVDVWWNSPPPLASFPRASVFLRYFPVVSIDKVEVSDQVLDAAGARFSSRTGRLFTLTGPPSRDLSRELLGTTRITYTTGWDTIPGDLYEIVLGAISPQWAARSAQASGAIGGTGGISSINLVDVGSIDLADSTSFAKAASASGGPADPLLGPYLSMLNDTYLDHRNGIGHQWMPTTEPVVVPP